MMLMMIDNEIVEAVKKLQNKLALAEAVCRGVETFKDELDRLGTSFTSYEQALFKVFAAWRKA